MLSSRLPSLCSSSHAKAPTTARQQCSHHQASLLPVHSSSKRLPPASSWAQEARSAPIASARHHVSSLPSHAPQAHRSRLHTRLAAAGGDAVGAARLPSLEDASSSCPVCLWSAACWHAPAPRLAWHPDTASCADVQVTLHAKGGLRFWEE